ncbi:MAG: ATP synthase F1 subunit gamma [Candidatus Marinimicrobia bacterium]|nr:ATP synthase F1 subunit gamma [Candidatus Neomarinimicrobiota bacterium]
MASLKDIRQRLKAIKNIQKVTNAMKMVAAARLRRSQMNMEQARPYARRINEVLEHLLPAIDRSLNPLLAVREPEKVGFVIITADRGLCGGFNGNIIRTAIGLLQEYDRDEVSLICVGKKGRNYFVKEGYNVIGQYTDFWNELAFQHAAGIMEQVRRLYLENNLDKVTLIYNEFKNVVRQEIVTRQLLPLILSEVENGSGPAPEFGEYLFEPSEENIVNSLVPRHLNVQVWQALLESNAAEQAARMNAMGAATENAGEMISTLTLEYNKARQAAITKELLEIVSGAEALVKA